MTLLSKASLKMLPLLNFQCISNSKKAPARGNICRESLTVKQSLFVIFTSETSRRISLCHLCHFVIFVIFTSEEPANMTARSWASAQVHITTVKEFAFQNASIQDVNCLTHLSLLTRVSGGFLEKGTSGVCTSVRSVHWHYSTHCLLFGETNFWLFSKGSSCWW